MAKKHWYHVVRDSRLVYKHRERFAYVWGANGECPKNYEEAKALVERCWRMNPEHFQQFVIEAGHTKEELIEHIIGKICFDCSGFVCAVTQYEGSIYDMRVLRDYNSTSLRSAFLYPTTPNDGLWGGILWKNGHVAVDGGNGFAYDFGAEFVDVREYRFVDADTPTVFTTSGQLPWVDYEFSVNF